MVTPLAFGFITIFTETVRTSLEHTVYSVPVYLIALHVFLKCHAYAWTFWTFSPLEHTPYISYMCTFHSAFKAHSFPADLWHIPIQLYAIISSFFTIFFHLEYCTRSFSCFYKCIITSLKRIHSHFLMHSL